MSKEMKEKIHQILLTKMHIIDTPTWSGEVIEEFQFDAIINEIEELLPSHPEEIRTSLATSLRKYVNEKHNQDECSGFIDGFNYASQFQSHPSEIKKIYDWLMSENREPAQTYFTSGESRDLAKEIEFRLSHPKQERKEIKCEHKWTNVGMTTSMNNYIVCVKCGLKP